MEILLYAVLAVIVLLFGVIIIRTLMFKPKAASDVSNLEVKVDSDRAVENLRQLIRCRTVSYRDAELEDNAEFEKLIKLLPELYPNVFSVCEYKELPDRGLLFKWSGSEKGDPTVLMAHYDVVPVDESGWKKPPFEAVLENGIIWGRGSLDTKVTFGGVLLAADTLISEGFTPKNDIYFAFSGGEEVNGKGAQHIVDWFAENNITPSMVLDEGGAVVQNVFPGVKAPCGLIGIAEKGMMDVEYICKSSGGHASAPKPNSPLVRLANACLKLEKNPFKSHLTQPVAQMFDTLGRHSSFLYRMIFANLWAFGPVLDIICKASGGELNALMRTTVAWTRSQGSPANNVLPSRATMVSNIRLNPADTIDSAMEYIKKTINDENVEVSLIYGMNPSRISKTDCEGYKRVADAVANTWKGSIVSPYLMVQCSDSRHYGKISDRVYRFSAMDLTTEERATIHGHNERIRVEALERTVEFYIRLIKNS